MILEAHSNQTTSPRNAFEARALPLQGYLYSKALQLTRNGADADDLLQDTLVLGLRKFHLFREGTNLKAWLARLLFNLFVSGYRRKRSRPDGVPLDSVAAVVTDESFIDQSMGMESLNSDQLEAHPEVLENISQELKHGLQDLDPRYRSVLLLSTLGDRSYQDIAKELSVPVGTVMSRLSRAKSHMREYLAANPAMAG
ncbi:MAG: sigma-70 family RNA polymerase sigma factor [Planctomycetes bacterium]|nr:sigma-70 family RNA polymerase sigma factor [Planctomycetota bacterium]